MANLSAYNSSVLNTLERATSMRRVLLDPFRRDNGFFTPTNQAEANERASILKRSIANTVYESIGAGAEMVAAVHSRALIDYANKHNGALPSDDLLANIHTAIENTYSIGKSKSSVGGIYESADIEGTLSTTEGIMMRDRMVSLILPVQLMTISSAIVTYMPWQFNSSEFFRINRVASSSFGSLTKGDIINYDYSGLYAVMDQRVALGLGDNSTTEFTFDTTAKYGIVYPFIPHRMKIIYDREVVANDNGSGVIAGAFTSNGTQVVVSGTVSYTEGKCTISFSQAPIEGIELHIGYDVNIEKAPDLIPRIDHSMESRILYPHESAIAGNASLQALFKLRREFGLDIDNMTMQAMRNLLAADKDRKHLSDMYFYAKDQTVWNQNYSDTLSLTQNYETLKQSLLDMSSNMLKKTGVSGVVGLVADSLAANIFKYLPSQYFQFAPGYREIAQPHYVGRAFGLWDIYCDPHKAKSYSALAFGRGPEHGQTAYVAGDAVPAMMFTHPRLGDLQSNHTMWELAYRDMQPFDGSAYLAELIITKD